MWSATPDVEQAVLGDGRRLVVEVLEFVVAEGDSADRARRRDDTTEQPITRLLGGTSGGGLRGNERELSQQVDELFDVADEVTARKLLGLDDLGEALTGRPCVCDGCERRIGSAMRRQSRTFLVGGDLLGQRTDLLPSLADGGGGEPRSGWSIRAAVLVGDDADESGER